MIFDKSVETRLLIFPTMFDCFGPPGVTGGRALLFPLSIAGVIGERESEAIGGEAWAAGGSAVSGASSDMRIRREWVKISWVRMASVRTSAAV